MKIGDKYKVFHNGRVEERTFNEEDKKELEAFEKEHKNKDPDLEEIKETLEKISTFLEKLGFNK